MYAAKNNETETLHNKSQASLHPPVQKKGWNLFLRKAGDIFELALSGLLQRMYEKMSIISSFSCQGTYQRPL